MHFAKCTPALKVRLGLIIQAARATDAGICPLRTDFDGETTPPSTQQVKNKRTRNNSPTYKIIGISVHPGISRPATGRLSRRTDGSTVTKPRHQNHPRPFPSHQSRQKSSVKTNQGGAAIKSRPKRALFPVVWEAESRKRNLRELREKHLKPFLPCGLRCDLPKTMTADCQ